ncbi:DinB family protein [Spirosoma areae]
MEGYAPQVGTMLSMLNWMSDSVVRATRKLTPTELDYLHDDKANTIGALLMHLAATEVIYQELTFANRQDFSDQNKKKWGVAMNLGDEARKQIKGNSLDYYLNALSEVRATTAAEFKQRDDAWISKVDPQFFGNQPTNNYCKWFHVAEHIGNHRGQITWIQKRLPGAKPTKD